MKFPRFWIPKSARPKYGCLICGTVFSGSESLAYQRHVSRCARSHAAELEEMRVAAGRDTVFFKPADEEYARWVREHGRVG